MPARLDAKRCNYTMTPQALIELEAMAKHLGVKKSEAIRIALDYWCKNNENGELLNLMARKEDDL